MPEEEKTKTGRIYAYRHIYNGAAVTATKLFFDDNTELTLDGHMDFPAMLTVEVTYVDKPKRPSELKKIELRSG